MNNDLARPKEMMDSFRQFAETFKLDLGEDEEGEFLTSKTRMIFNGFYHGWEEREELLKRQQEDAFNKGE